MAQTKTTKVSSKAPTQSSVTVAEIKEWYSANKDKLDLLDTYATKTDTDKLLKQLRDVGKTYRKTVSTFDKEKLIC